ncbi:hypothetical protein NDU88_005674, partial [Pleurodeles waltl]
FPQSVHSAAPVLGPQGSSISALHFTHSRPSGLPVPGTPHTLSARSPQFSQSAHFAAQVLGPQGSSISALHFTHSRPSACQC